MSRLKLIFRNLKTMNQKKAEKHSIKVRAEEYLKHYESAYIEYTEATLDSDRVSYSAIAELEYIGRRFFGIEQEAFNLVKYKVEKRVF